MSLENDEVQLTSLQAPSVDFDHVHTAWEFLIQNSVEIITAGFPHVHDFVDNYCLYFFVIQHIVDLEVQEGNGKKLLFTDPAQDEYDRYLETIGILYLSASHIPNTLNVGVALLPEARRFGFGRQATCLAINWAFKELECHRIQAQVVDGDPTLLDISLGLFTGLGFSHEGTLRRALFYPTAPMQLFPPDTSGEWRDVINLAVLDMDWAMWKTYPRISREIMKSRWDDLFSRHEREREAMLRLEEWEEERKLAVAQAGGIDDEARASQATKNETYTRPELQLSALSLEAIWETASQASSVRSGADRHPQKDAVRPSTRHRLSTDTAMAESPLTVDRLFEEKWSHVWRGSSPGAHFSKQTGALEVTASSSHVPSEQWRDYVDSSSFIQPPAHRTSGKRASAAIEDDTASDSTGGRGEGPRRRRRVDACKTASVYSSSGAESSSEVSDSEGDPFSDAESVPRSASALSSRSHSPASTADSWDLVVDEISEGSYGIRSFSENEE